MSSSPQQPNPEPGPEPIPEETKEEAKEEVKPEMKEGKNGETEEEKKEEEKEETKVEKEEDKKEESKKEKKDSWKDFIYNPRTGEFMGRTASSWGLILLFYLVFYGFLTAMFCLTMWVMLQTLDENVPRRQDRVANPGLVVRPHAAEISFNRSDLTNYNEYTRQLHELLQRYNDSIQEQNDLCMVGEYTEQDEEPIKKVCQFKRSMLRECSGLSDTSFGFAEGKPCIIIKMNRVSQSQI
ncbi:sodium/potassium-transporting ATPase subunit beta-3-like [Xyrichtys novacula]|uniref:Sodium/potassium-transporting ATPase subunit beta n=1 Tax=Xyrichtys novacula TaxID=13765 RepID=A0AAV1FZB8_XYRNO|nr:sodium/potassium-transporting ATPase subunit beta-3-like [Xyrichtys novacula]